MRLATGRTAINRGARPKLQQRLEKKKLQKAPVGIFIEIKVFTCLSNLSKIGLLHEYDVILITEGMNRCLHGNVLLGI